MDISLMFQKFNSVRTFVVFFCIFRKVSTQCRRKACAYAYGN